MEQDEEELPPPFYENGELWKMNKRGRPLKYVTMEAFQEFRNHDHARLKWRVGYLFWAFNVLLVLAAISIPILFVLAINR